MIAISGSGRMAEIYSGKYLNQRRIRIIMAVSARGDQKYH